MRIAYPKGVTYSRLVDCAPGLSGGGSVYQQTAEVVYYAFPLLPIAPCFDTLQCLMPLSKYKELYLLKNAKGDSLSVATLSSALLLSQRRVPSLSTTAAAAVAVGAATADDSREPGTYAAIFATACLNLGLVVVLVLV